MKNNSTRKLLLATLLLFAPATLLLAQTKVKVWGQVTDANGPMAGASVIENGTTNGAPFLPVAGRPMPKAAMRCRWAKALPSYSRS